MRQLCLLGVFMICLLVACREDDPVVTPVATAVSQTSTETPTTGGTETAVPTQPPTPTATPVPTATPLPPKTLTVCMATEPSDLYLYGSPFLSAVAVRHGLYESLYTTLDYQYQPQGLQTLPTLENGVVLQTVEAVAGNKVLDSRGVVVTLARGTTVINAAGEVEEFDGETPIMMPQLSVEFTFQPMMWSDGTPVTASDSVFSFEVAASPDTPANKSKIERTTSYQAINELTVRWTGIPGFIDSDYLSNVWQPLPSHQLAQLSPAELRTAESSARLPLSNGPYVITDWVPATQITLERNPYYYRAAEGFPHIDRVLFRFGYEAEGALTAVQSGECHIVTQDTLTLDTIPAIDEAAAAGNLLAYIQPAAAFEHIDFGIDSDSVYGDALGRPDWFEDARVRQALVMCSDRQRMIDEILYGRSTLMNAYIPTNHPIYPADATQWPYDPAAANALLDEVGYVDTDGDGIREDAILSFRPFTITFSTDDASPVRQQIGQILQENWLACGIAMRFDYYAPAEWYVDGPLGPLFGRRFDVAAFAWLTDAEPACDLYLSRNITGAEADGFGGWGNVNATGWVNSDYDAACETALLSLPGTPTYVENHQTAVRIFAEKVPIIPLFQNVKIAVTAPTVQNFHPDSLQLSELWNLYELDVLQP